MLDLIIKNIHRQPCKKKTKTEEQSNATTPQKETVVVEIDYDKLAEAFVKAEAKVQEERVQKEREEHERLQIEWEKALKCQRYRGNRKILKFLDWLTRPIRIIFGLITFRKKNATSDNATYALFKICNEYMLWFYQLSFYLVTIFFVLSVILYNELSIEIPIGQFWCGMLALFALLIARIIRIAKLESANSQNKETITTIFNSIVSFTAMVFAVIAVVITLITGGNNI